MAQDTSFQLDIEGAGRIILQELAMPLVQQSARAIADRARSMGASQSSNPPGFEVNSRVGVIKRGSRAIATVTVNDTGDPHDAYVGRMALTKAKDAGRVK